MKKAVVKIILGVIYMTGVVSIVNGAGMFWEAVDKTLCTGVPLKEALRLVIDSET